jgi:hypothetical protein
MASRLIRHLGCDRAVENLLSMEIGDDTVRVGAANQQDLYQSAKS